MCTSTLAALVLAREPLGASGREKLLNTFVSYTVYCRDQKSPLISIILLITCFFFLHSFLLPLFSLCPSVHSFIIQSSPSLPSSRLSPLSIHTIQSFLSAAKSLSVSSYPLLCMCVFLMSVPSQMKSCVWTISVPLLLCHCYASGLITKAFISFPLPVLRR